MEDKIKLILEMLNKNSLDDFLKNQESMIDDYKQNGWKDTHPDNIEDIKTGLHYSKGYAIGHIELMKSVNELFDMSIDEIKELKKENERIDKENKEYMDNLLKKIKK